MSKTRQLGNIVLLEFLKKFSGDIYLIALPAIAASLNSNRQHVQSMVSFFLVGVVISQLISGPLSDHIGRRKVLLNCILIFIIGTFVCASSQWLLLLFIGVFIMGLGIGSAPVIGKAIIFDLYNKSGKTALFLVITSAFVVWAPAIAMAIGGNISHYFGWEFIFILSGCLGVIAS
jgi:MFS family permease